MANYTFRYTYPHSTTDIKDESIGNPQDLLVLPLHRPFMPIRAAKGEPNVVGWYTGDQALKEFGEETFDLTDKYWRNEQTYLQNAIFPGQACFIARLCDPAAKIASLVIEQHVTADVDVPQYERDEDGRFVLDEAGERIPAKGSDGAPIVTKGISLKWALRKLEENEEYNKLEQKTVNVGNKTTRIYPVWCYQANSPGSYGKRLGSKIWFDYQAQSDDIVTETQTIMFNFAPMQQPSKSNLAVSVGDRFDYVSNIFVPKPDTIDPYTNRYISFSNVIDRNYYDTNNNPLLPYKVKFYDKYYEEIAKAILEVETTNPTLTSPWMVNIISLEDITGAEYHNVIFDENTVHLNSATIHYLDGGDDGDTSDEMFEDLYRQFLKMTIFPEIIDTAHYPITHIYDVGYSLETKFAFASFMANQKKCKIEMAAQDSNRHLYNMDEAISVAAAIKARCALTPESTLYGTEALRAEIFGQSGYLNDTSITSIIPFTFWMAQKRSVLHNAPYVKGTVKGYPNNRVDIFRKINFIPYNPEQKQIAWDGAANYCQYANMTNLFIADVKTIYRSNQLAQSVLSDTTYTDCAIYLMYILDEVWTYYVGKTGPLNSMFLDIKKSIESKAYKAFGAYYGVTSTVYQTDEDIQVGDQLHIDTVLLGEIPTRRWYNTLIARRLSLTQEV